jgi:hypothetical protein
MKSEHLSDEEIQILASGKTHAESSVHLADCSHCRERVELYRLVLEGITQQPREVFDFDVAALVMARLDRPVEASRDGALLLCFSIATAGVAGFGIYYFRKYFRLMFESFMSYFFLLATTIIVLLLLLLVIDMYKSYQNKMRHLDLYGR